MIELTSFFNRLEERGVRYFTGVPDSLLKSTGSYIMDHVPAEQHVIAANEGAAVALASGYHLATGDLAMVYMQNSGFGNAVNPLTSLADPQVYAIPMLLMIGWRGEPGVKDEPQHVKQGEISEALLKAMSIPYQILSADQDEAEEQTGGIIDICRERRQPVALLVRKNTFAPYNLRNKSKNPFTVSREDMLREILNAAPDNAVFVSTTGKTSREVFEIREQSGMGHERDFLTVGSMGHASQIALAIAKAKPQQPVVCIDGDGAFLMHMGGNGLVSQLQPPNYYHIVLNNGAHESVGGQPTCALGLDFQKISEGLGYQHYGRAEDLDSAKRELGALFQANGPRLLEIGIATGSRADLGRPTTTPQENKNSFMENLRNHR